MAILSPEPSSVVGAGAGPLILIISSLNVWKVKVDVITTGTKKVTVVC